MQAPEIDYRKYGLIGTVIFHAGLLILLLFAVFEGPNPPLGGSGTDVQFGFVGEEGFGEVQTMSPPNESTNTEDSRPAPEQTEEAPQKEATPVEQEKSEEEEVMTTSEESPVSIKSSEKAEPKKVEQPKEEVKVVEKAVSLYPGKSKVETGAGGRGTSNAPAGNNTGDKPGKVGDQGDPAGSLTGKDLYGKPGTGGPGNGGSGGGASLNMPGWRYDVRPKEDPYENETGKVVFKITIDDNGEIIKVDAVETNVSPKVVSWYREQVFKTTFSRTNNQANSQGATGYITFIIRSR